MACLPYFPIYPKDIFTDDRMNELKSEEKGLFILFLCKLWINENSIRDDDIRISKILNISLKKWRDLKDKLLSSGLLVVDWDGSITNNRMTKEYYESVAKCQQATTAAMKRWGNKINPTQTKENKGIISRNTNDYPDVFGD